MVNPVPGRSVSTLFAALEAWNDPTGRGALSENATQILSTAVGGIIGVLAGYVGGIEASVRKTKPPEPDAEVDRADGHDEDVGK